jgi:Lrp/AsnC family transcriptional regulator
MSKEVPKLDPLDVRILEQLQTDESLPVAELAEQVGSSKTVVWRRIQRLQDLGVIRGRVALLDHKKVGLPIMIFAHIKMTRHDRDVLPKFIDAVDSLPQVIECHTLMGNVDFLLKIVIGTLEDYEHFVWQKLSKIDGVREISSSISLSQNVNRTRLPLRAS